MSVYIKGMKMPTKWEACPFANEFAECTILQDSPMCTLNRMGNDCPLIPVPEHGRLVDVDALEQDAQIRLQICNKYGNQFQKPYEVMRSIALAPTIIPADGEVGEC